MKCAAILFLAVPANQAQEPVADYSAVVDANTRFALKVARTHAPSIKKNEIISPIALSSGFALLRNGASTQCADQIGSTFEFGRIPLDNMNRAYGGLLNELVDRPPVHASSKAGIGGNVPVRPNGLFLANSFWDLTTIRFSAFFRSINDSYYHAEVAQHKRQDAAAAISKWAYDKSFGTMTGLTTPVSEDDFVFTSLLYFRAYWSHKFSANATRQADFTLLSGATKPVLMMKQSGAYQYERTDQFEAIILPYSNGRYLYIFLPDKTSSLRDFQAELRDENWAKWTESMTTREGTIELPKFHINGKIDVQELLKGLGSDCAFESLAAFSKAVPAEGAKLTHAEQTLSFASDELGSEAVAFTEAGGVVGGVPGGVPGWEPPPPFHMIVNRPFFAAIMDLRTRTIVLIASVVEP